MKIIIVCILVSVCFQAVALAQTPEQIQQMEEAQRKADSIMNSPQMKEMMKQAKAMEAEFATMEADRKAAETTQSKPKKVQAKTESKSTDDFYWRNTIASNTQGKFSNWNYGAASLRAGFYDRKIRAYVYIPFGSISKDGQLNISLPSIDTNKLPFKPITTPYSEGDMVFYYDHLNFTNPNTEWVSTRFTLEVHQGDKRLGYLKMGNTIKPVVNLNSPCCTGKAGDGYAASWVYVTNATSASGETDSKTGGKITHKMNLKQGWNLIKIDVSGSDENNRWMNKAHTVLSNLPADGKYYFMNY